MRSPVVAAGDGAEALLPCGVPNLQLDRLSVQVDGADFEIDADCGYVGFRVCIVRKAQQQA